MAGCFGTLKPAEEKGLLSARFGDDDEVNGATVSTDGGAGPDAIYTIGHGTLPAEARMELLEAQDITRLVDIRSFPGSRHNPQFGREEMERWVPAAGIDYRWLKVLGGRRRSQDESRHMALRHPAFRSYADYMETNDFASGMAQLLTLATEQPTAIMCSESVWWKCHRRLVSDRETERTPSAGRGQGGGKRSGVRRRHAGAVTLGRSGHTGETILRPTYHDRR
mgnify:CR=1 FL=1